MLRSMGCRDQDVIAALNTDPGWLKYGGNVMTSLWMQFYYRLVKSGYLRTHLHDLADFRRGAGPQKIADPTWCRQIDPAAISRTRNQ